MSVHSDVVLAHTYRMTVSHAKETEDETQDGWVSMPQFTGTTSTSTQLMSIPHPPKQLFPEFKSADPTGIRGYISVIVALKFIPSFFGPRNNVLFKIIAFHL